MSGAPKNSCKLVYIFWRQYRNLLNMANLVQMWKRWRKTKKSISQSPNAGAIKHFAPLQVFPWQSFSCQNIEKDNYTRSLVKLWQPMQLAHWTNLTMKYKFIIRRNDTQHNGRALLCRVSHISPSLSVRGAQYYPEAATVFSFREWFHDISL